MKSTHIGSAPTSAPTIIGTKLATCSSAQVWIQRDGLFTRAASTGANSCSVAPTKGGTAATSPAVRSLDPSATANAAK
jgi:hypothetical protein